MSFRLTALPIALLAIAVPALTALSFHAETDGGVARANDLARQTPSNIGQATGVGPAGGAESTLTDWDRLARATKIPALVVEPVDPRSGRSQSTGRIIVKVREDWAPRAPRAGAGELTGSAAADLDRFNAILRGLNLTIRPALDQDPEQIAAFVDRLHARTGKLYPDLRTYFYVEGAEQQLTAVGQLLASLSEVTAIEIEMRTVQSQVDCVACGDTDCGLNPYQWATDAEGVCAAPLALDDDGNCIELFTWAPGAAYTGCCEVVGAIRPSCIADVVPGGPGPWDGACVALAELFCGETVANYWPGATLPGSNSCLGGQLPAGTIQQNDWQQDDDTACGPPPNNPPNFIWGGFSTTTYDTDAVILLPPSYQPHLIPTSNENDCCAAVCAVDYLCCTNSWDETCAAIAFGLTAGIGGEAASPCSVTTATLAWPLAVWSGVQGPVPPVDNPGTAWVPPASAPGYLIDWLPASLYPGNVNPSSKLLPSTQSSPYYGFELLGLDPANPPFSASDFPLLGAAEIPIIDGDNTTETVTVQANSMPLALWGTADRAAFAAVPIPPVNDDCFDPYRSITGFMGGGFDMEGVNELINNSTPSGDAPAYFARGIKVGVVDKAAYVNHEEFLDANGDSTITVEADVPMSLVVDLSDTTAKGFGGVTDCTDLAGYDTVVPGTPSVLWAHHGTAVLGVLFAERDGKGVSGLCTNADEKWFFPSTTRGDPDAGLPSGDRLPSALLSAADILTEPDASGDAANVCVVPVNWVTSQPINTAHAVDPNGLVAVIISMGSDGGLTWILPAGNGGSPVVAATVLPDLGVDASRCIVTSAVWPGARTGQGVFNDVAGGIDYARVGESNFDGGDEPTGNLTTGGWGRGVATCGYGDLFIGDDEVVETESGYAPDCAESLKLRTYTARFSGTSAACAHVGGLIACLQAHAKVIFNGIGLPPSEWVAILRSPAASRPPFFQPLSPTAPLLGGADTSGESDQNAFTWGFPSALVVASNITTGTWVDLMNDSSATVLIGQKQSGNSFSLKRLDGAVMVIKSAQVPSGASTAGYGRAAVFYPSTSRAIDLQLLRTLNVDEPLDVQYLRARLSSRISGGIVLAFGFAFNPRLRRYDYWGFETLAQVDPPAPLNFCVPAYRTAADYVRMNDPNYPNGVIAVRLITGGYGMAGQFLWTIDLAEIEVNNPIVPVDPCVN